MPRGISSWRKRPITSPWPSVFTSSPGMTTRSRLRASSTASSAPPNALWSVIAMAPSPISSAWSSRSATGDRAVVRPVGVHVQVDDDPVAARRAGPRPRRGDGRGACGRGASRRASSSVATSSKLWASACARPSVASVRASVVVRGEAGDLGSTTPRASSAHHRARRRRPPPAAGAPRPRAPGRRSRSRRARRRAARAAAPRGRARACGPRAGSAGGSRAASCAGGVSSQPGELVHERERRARRARPSRLELERDRAGACGRAGRERCRPRSGSARSRLRSAPPPPPLSRVTSPAARRRGREGDRGGSGAAGTRAGRGRRTSPPSARASS